MQESSKQNYLHGAAIMAAGVVVIKILGAIYKIPLGNILGDEGYGYFSVAYNIYNVFLTMATAGMPVALSRMISEADTLGRPMQARKIFRVAWLTFATIGLILGLRGPVVRVKRQTAARHARIQQQADRIHVGRGIARAAPEDLGRHEFQLLGRPVLRVRAGGRTETDRAVCGAADVVRADTAVICPALRQDAAQRLGQRGQLRARERLQPVTEQAGGIQCVFVHVIRTSLCPCWHVYITL